MFTSKKTTQQNVLNLNFVLIFLTQKTDNLRYCKICKLYNKNLIEMHELTSTHKNQTKHFF